MKNNEYLCTRKDLHGFVYNKTYECIDEETFTLINEAGQTVVAPRIGFLDFTFTTQVKEEEEKVNHPSYYQHPSGIEVIDIVRHHDFCIGNALKYLFRAGLKKEQGKSEKEKEIEDLKKAIWYINDKIKQLEQ